MEHIEVRSIVSRDEFEQACDIWPAVFPESRDFFRDRLVHDPSYSMDTTWIAKVDGVVAAAIQIFPYWMWCGSARLKVGGIGSVATLPEFRHRGLAQQILRMQARWMKAHDYDLSLLFTGINSFYGQVGWKTLTGSELVLDSGSIPPPPLPADCTVGLFERADLQAVMDIYDAYNRFRTAAMIRTKEYWLGQLSWNVVEPSGFLVAKVRGRAAAFLRFSENDEGELVIRDCCYLPGEESAVSALLGACLQTAAEKAKTVRAKLPDDHILAQWLRGWKADIEQTDGLMWKAFDCVRLLQKLSGVFTERIQSAGADPGILPPCRLLLRCGDDEALFSIREQQVEVESVTEKVGYDQAVDLSDTELLKLVVQGIDACKESPKIYGNPYLHRLFPNQHGVFWNADNF